MNSFNVTDFLSEMGVISLLFVGIAIWGRWRIKKLGVSDSSNDLTETRALLLYDLYQDLEEKGHIFIHEKSSLKGISDEEFQQLKNFLLLFEKEEPLVKSEIFWLAENIPSQFSSILIERCITYFHQLDQERISENDVSASNS